MAAITICSDFGAQENTVCHCCHFLCTCLPGSDGSPGFELAKPLRDPTVGWEGWTKGGRSAVPPAVRGRTLHLLRVSSLVFVAVTRSSFLSKVFLSRQHKNEYRLPSSDVRGEHTVRMRVQHVKFQIWSEWSSTHRFGESPRNTRGCPHVPGGWGGIGMTFPLLSNPFFFLTVSLSNQFTFIFVVQLLTHTSFSHPWHFTITHSFLWLCSAELKVNIH